jgi:hypothetical protein
MRRIERFDNYLSYKGLNDNIVTNDLKLSVGTIGKSRKEGRDLSDRVVELILNFYTDLNRVWLLTGEGEMLITDTAPRIEDVSIVRADEEVEVDIDSLMRTWHTTPENFANIIGETIDFVRSCNGKLLPSHIIKLQEFYGTEVVDRYAKYAKTVEVEVVEAFPVVTEAVNADPNTSIEKVIEEDGAELEHINPNHLLRNLKVDAAELVKSTSMLPTYQPNDWVFVKLIKDKLKITDGNIYYINCRNRPTMIRLVKFEGADKLRLIAQNSRYGDIVINREDIIDIGTCEALFRMTFGDQYSELETLRRQKDMQIEERNTQINGFIDIQREMVAEIREQGKRNDKERERTDMLIDKLIGNK